MDGTNATPQDPAKSTTPRGHETPTKIPSARSDGDGGHVDFLRLVRRRCPTLSRAWDASDEERAAWAREAAEQERRDTDTSRQAAWGRLARALGPDYADATIGAFQVYADPAVATRQRRILEALSRYMDGLPDALKAGENVLLYGPSGTGKDLLLSALAKAAILQHGRHITWQRGSRFFLEARAAMGSGEADLLDRYARVGILYLSDPLPPIGPLTAHQAAMLYEVVDERYRQRRPSWVSLNVASRGEAENRLGVQIIDRLAAGALTAHFDWPSYRRSAGSPIPYQGATPSALEENRPSARTVASGVAKTTRKPPNSGGEIE